VAEEAQTEAQIKQDRLNFTKLSKFEREEFNFRIKFKKQFNSALELLTRNDFNSLRETVQSAEEEFQK
jgi:hypothetical protein